MNLFNISKRSARIGESMKFLLNLLALVATVSLVFSAKAQELQPSDVEILPLPSRGGMDSGGGDPYVMDFQNKALQFSRLLRQFPVSGLDANELAEDIIAEKTQITSKDQVMVDGVQKCAKFDRVHRAIEIARSCWLRMDTYYKVITICHEFRGIYGHSDYNENSECRKLPRLNVMRALEPEYKLYKLRISGLAAEELANIQEPESPFSCTRNKINNPTSDKEVFTYFCDLEAKVDKAGPVEWFPKYLLYHSQIDITGPTADYLVQKGLSRTPLMNQFHFVSCSTYAWDQDSGHCSITMRSHAW